MPRTLYIAHVSEVTGEPVIRDEVQVPTLEEEARMERLLNAARASLAASAMSPHEELLTDLGMHREDKVH